MWHNEKFSNSITSQQNDSKNNGLHELAIKGILIYNY